MTKTKKKRTMPTKRMKIRIKKPVGKKLFERLVARGDMVRMDGNWFYIGPYRKKEAKK